MTFYISIQDVDYDDYPRGSDTKVGTFDSKEEAESFLADSGLFVGYTYGGNKVVSWSAKGRPGKHTVYVKNLLNAYMVKPEDYAARYAVNKSMN